MPRTGVFICHCGLNIASRVDVPKVLKGVESLPDVVFAYDYRFMCSSPGQNLIKEAIKEHRLNRVVIGACSPDMHLPTFQRAILYEGLNPYLISIANIREQCSWVTEEREEATAKAIDLVTRQIKRVSRQDPLTDIDVQLNKTTLVIGGGIAGIQAALDIAEGDRKVILVEKSPSIGGRMAQLDETFPTLDCSQCIMTPKMVDVAQHPNITLYTYSELEDVEGYVGNFRVKIRRKARYVDEEACTACGECWNACPVQNNPNIGSMPRYSETIDEENLLRLNQIIEPYGEKDGSLIHALQDINSAYNYLPEFALKYVAERFHKTLSEIYHIATFYAAFSLEPRGKHLIKVCMGTACHARGAPRIVEEIERRLEIRVGETTGDGLFTLQTVNCLGCCALGPVVLVDGDYHQMTVRKVDRLLKRELDE